MDLKIDIDPKTMVDFMEKCSDFGNRIRPSIVGHTQQCLHCDYGYDTNCNCQITKVHGYWKGVKYERKKQWASTPNPTLKPVVDTVTHPLPDNDKQ